MENLKAKEPIIYDYSIDLRFGDLDPYGHLNSSRYLDIISSARLIYLEKVLHTSIHEITEKGLGFYLTKSSQEFLKPVVGLKPVRVISFVQEIRGSRLIIPYEMLSEDKSKLYSKGLLEFALVDVKTGKPCELPDWGMQYFFKT